MPPSALQFEGTPSPFDGADGSLIMARSAMPFPDKLVAVGPWRPHLVGSKRLAIPSFPTISRRSQDGSDTMINMMIILLGLVFFSLLLASLLFLFVRRRRQQHSRNGDLPAYDDVKHAQNPHGLTIETSHNGRSSIFFIAGGGEPMLSNPRSPPHSPDNVPQIHITFPDEHDENGETKSGRVLVVRVGDNATVGLEPMQEEQLPAYEKEAKGAQFQSIDMDQIGGLKEKDESHLR
ncbi:hypothetical protein E4U53_002838 [Claviceps sorghi]|nr:hypothetical protein E4U53_002838 [Claviceps sorghi]